MTRLLGFFNAVQAMNAQGLQDKLLDALVSAAVGALVALAAFRSRLDRHTDALANFKEQRAEDLERDAKQRQEDRDADRAAREAIAKTFSEMCASMDRARSSEVAFIQRQVSSFDQALRDSERRQRHILDLMAAIARKLQISHRLTDAMVVLDDDTPNTR